MSTPSSSTSSLIGENVFLRDLQLSDVNNAYYQWMNDPEVTQYLESRFKNPSIKEIERYVEENIADPNTYLFAIIDKKNDRHIGNIKLGPINRVHRRASIGIVIGKKELFGKGFGTETIRLAAAFAFNDLKLHKLTAGCYASNRAAEKIFTKNGFAKEGIRRLHSVYDGKYTDDFVFGLINPKEPIDE